MIKKAVIYIRPPQARQDVLFSVSAAASEGARRLRLCPPSDSSRMLGRGASWRAGGAGENVAFFDILPRRRSWNADQAWVEEGAGCFSGGGCACSALTS